MAPVAGRMGAVGRRQVGKERSADNLLVAAELEEAVDNSEAADKRPVVVGKEVAGKKVAGKKVVGKMTAGKEQIDK